MGVYPGPLFKLNKSIVNLFTSVVLSTLFYTNITTKIEFILCIDGTRFLDMDHD